MTEVVRRAKVLIINSNNEILLAYSQNYYEFPGGHVEENETLVQTVKREVLEETGIDLEAKDIEPFACAIGYSKDWPEKGKNRKTEIYYYEIKTDEKSNLKNTGYTEDEIEGNFEVRYLPLANVEEELIKNVEEYKSERGRAIAKEMIELLGIYKASNL